MKTLSPLEIESLLGIRPCTEHPLDILGYGYTTEGARRFRAEKPDFQPQLVEHVHRVLAEQGVFPPAVDRQNPELATFIVLDQGWFRLSTMEEIGVGRFERFFSPPMSAKDAAEDYVRRVANPDYISRRKRR